MNKYGVLALIIIAITVPGFIQNRIVGAKVEKEVKQVLTIAKNICDSDCKDYPDDWIVPGAMEEAEAYCRDRCLDNMRDIRHEYLDNFPILYTNKYNYYVSQLYCIAGLYCPQLVITKIINLYP